MDIYSIFRSMPMRLSILQIRYTNKKKEKQRREEKGWEGEEESESSNVNLIEINV